MIDLETLSLSPERVGDLTRDELAQLLARVKSLEGVVLAALLTGDGAGATSPNESLDADAIARRLGTTRRWVFRHLASLPFVKKTSRKTLVASSRDLDRYLRARS